MRSSRPPTISWYRVKAAGASIATARRTFPRAASAASAPAATSTRPAPIRSITSASSVGRRRRTFLATALSGRAQHAARRSTPACRLPDRRFTRGSRSAAASGSTDRGRRRARTTPDRRHRGCARPARSRSRTDFDTFHIVVMNPFEPEAGKRRTGRAEAARSSRVSSPATAAPASPSHDASASRQGRAEDAVRRDHPRPRTHQGLHQPRARLAADRRARWWNSAAISSRRCSRATCAGSTTRRARGSAAASSIWC